MSPLRPVVLFDFDGTVADTIPLIVESFRQMAVLGGLPEVSEAEARSWIGRPLLPVLQERYPGRGEELTALYRAWNVEHHDELIRPVDGMSDLLAELDRAGLRLGIVSSKRTPMVQQGLRVLGLADHIDVLAGMDDTTEHKPSPAPLLFAADRLGAAPTDCVYVGDADVDVLAAKAAGMASVAVTWGAGEESVLRATEPDAVVHDTPALLRVLLGSRPMPTGGAS